MSNHKQLLRDTRKLRRLLRITYHKWDSGELNLYTGGTLMCNLADAIARNLLAYHALTKSQNSAQAAEDAETQRLLTAIGLNPPRT